MKENLTTEGVLLKITQCLEDKIPLSLIRYGDGEAIILNSFKDVKSLEFVFKRQLGYVPQINEIEVVRNNLIEAYKNCDIIGLPTDRRLQNRHDYWAKALSIFADNIGADIIDSKHLTSVDIHSFFLDKNYFDSLFEEIEVLNYVSCQDITEAIQLRYPNIKEVNSFIIAPEMKFVTKYDGEKHFPNQFNHIRRNIPKTKCEGVLCLVGAGVIGKIYCNWFRDQGGIAMDIGSVFDAFAGKVTRGSNRGINVEDVTYKI